MTDYIRWIRSRVGHDPVILVGVCAVIPNGTGDILLERRSDNGTWCLPGGHMEIGETAQATAVREIREELGVGLEVKDFLGVYTNRKIMTYANGDQSFPIGIFLIASISGLPVIDGETLEIGYFSKRSLPSNILEVHKQPIQDYFEGLRGIIR